MTPHKHAPSGAGFYHPALFYRTTTELLDQLRRFVHGELAADHSVLVALPTEHLDALRDTLPGEAHRIEWVNMTQAGRNPGRILPEVLTAFADDHPGRRVGVVGEPIWPERSQAEYAAAVQHEALINLAFADRDATIVCPYDATRLTPSALADATRTHPYLIDAGHTQVSTDYTDPATFAAAMAGPLPDPPADVAALVLLDITDLTHAREVVRQHARAAGLAPERVAELQLAVHELATNTLTHAGSPGILRIWRADDCLICEIHDRGHITDPLVGRRPINGTAEHGHGLLLVHHLCDLVQLHSTHDGTTVQIRTSLN